MKKNILFVINPISGGKSKQNFAALAHKHLDRSLFQASYVFSEYHGHAKELTALAGKNADILIAVGGDGTVNEVAAAASEQGSLFGIIPYGSGNGLARSLGIPLSPVKAVQLLNRFHITTIDSGLLNGEPFFNMAGMGFDAHISLCFADKAQRGLMGYIKTTFREFKNYVPRHYTITIDGREYTRKAFMVSIANSSQYGNNAHIAPFASLTDAVLDVCIIKHFSLAYLPIAALRMLSKTAHRSKYVEIIQGSRISIICNEPGPVHLDGEPVLMEKEVNITIRPQTLQVLT